jgi:hypothetical protein
MLFIPRYLRFKIQIVAHEAADVSGLSDFRDHQRWNVDSHADYEPNLFVIQFIRDE